MIKMKIQFSLQAWYSGSVVCKEISFCYFKHQGSYPDLDLNSSRSRDPLSLGSGDELIRWKLNLCLLTTSMFSRTLSLRAVCEILSICVFVSLLWLNHFYALYFEIAGFFIQLRLQKWFFYTYLFLMDIFLICFQLMCAPSWYNSGHLLIYCLEFDIL